MEVVTKMYVNPFWFGFGVGVCATIIAIFIIAAICNAIEKKK